MTDAARGANSFPLPGQPGTARPEAWDLPTPTQWSRLTKNSGKADALSRDPYLRESWATLLAVLGEPRAYEFAEKIALLWVRPDAFAAGTARRILAAVENTGFRPLAARPARLDRTGVRSLWAYALCWATMERLCLFDGIAALGPGLLMLYTLDEPSPRSAAARMTANKGASDPRARRPGGLRHAAGSPNLGLTMLHTADEGADVIRELGVFLPWQQRQELVAEAAHRVLDRGTYAWEDDVRTIEHSLPPMPTTDQPTTAPPAPLTDGPLTHRWAAVQAAAHQWPLVSKHPGPAAWPNHGRHT